MVTSAEVQVASLEVGDVAIFMDGDAPFAVAAASEVFDRLRMLDLVAGAGRRARVTVWAEQVVQVIGRHATAEPTRATGVLPAV